MDKAEFIFEKLAQTAKSKEAVRTGSEYRGPATTVPNPLTSRSIDSLNAYHRSPSMVNNKVVFDKTVNKIQKAYPNTPNVTPRPETKADSTLLNRAATLLDSKNGGK